MKTVRTGSRADVGTFLRNAATALDRPVEHATKAHGAGIDRVRTAIAVGRELERRIPERVTTAWWKEERGERIFVDYNQTARDRTIASAYWVRPRPHAPVSAPLRWEEIDDAEPCDFDIRTMPARYAEVGDLHADMDEHAFRLDGLLELAARDEREHELGDLPYPPEYPKMPGEPKRVQPSRARREDGADSRGADDAS
ncbi:hypothetical protein FHX80_12547 [Streptomyces brevispora]|uniref:DNA ligase D polymerase domain-containing protein n=1 Tax=Streptomyces brevispora TaxID=887462 RepID=A0A561TYP4_9ACTN|nr:hypothetical protein FHX80_12547 [Streptomyces brevispora]